MIFNESFHRIFRIPYKLAIVTDTKKGIPVIFLHGIASDSTTWKYVLPLLPANYRAITLDLLGFGSSYKPKSATYSINDHTASVLRTIRSLHLRQPPIIVGHSMGALIAIHLAKEYPKEVKSLVLVSAPLYTVQDIQDAASAKDSKQPVSSSRGLFYAYHKIISNQSFTLKAARAIGRLAPASNSFILTQDTWQSFRQSLTNTIMSQTTLNDVRQLQIPAHFMYGKLDVLLQQKNYIDLANEQLPNITITALRGAHMITKNGAVSIAAAIQDTAQSKNKHHSAKAANTKAKRIQHKKP